jgi:hypothetical protein
MKITKRQLRRIIKEEKHRLLKEFGSEEFGQQTKEFEPIPQIDGGVSMLDLDDYERLEDATTKAIRDLLRSGYDKEDVKQALGSIVDDAL